MEPSIHSSFYSAPCLSQQHACQLRPSRCIQQAAIIRRIRVQKTRRKTAQETCRLGILPVAHPEPAKAIKAVSCIRSRRKTCEAREGSLLASSNTLPLCSTHVTSSYSNVAHQRHQYHPTCIALPAACSSSESSNRYVWSKALRAIL